MMLKRIVPNTILEFMDIAITTSGHCRPNKEEFGKGKSGLYLWN